MKNGRRFWGALWRDAGGQPPDPRDLSLWAINRFCRMCWLALSERKQEWLPEGSHCAGWSPAQLGSENLSTVSLRRSGCFPAEPCPPERHWRIRQGQAVVARLFEALKIFPAVGGQPVFAELLPACGHVPHESPFGGLPTCPVVSHSLWQSGVAEQRSQFSLSSDSQSRRSDHGCRRGPSVDSRVPIGFF